MAVKTPPPNSPQNSGDTTAFILAAIDRVASDSRSNYESLRADIRQLYYLNILTLLTALGALITGLFTLLTR